MSNLDKLNQIITSLEEEGFYREADILMNVFERTAQESFICPHRLRPLQLDQAHLGFFKALS